MKSTLEMLGISKEEMESRIIDRAAQCLLSSTTQDEDGDEYVTSSAFKRTLEKLIIDRIDSSISSLAEKHVLPNVSEYIENLTLTETNKWGEAKGTPLTFIEYLVQRAENYMTEKVSYDGKAKNEAGGFSWSGTQTRITYLVNSHLHYSIDTAMKQALSVATSQISTGIQETCKVKLGEIAASLKVVTTTK